ncbi:MAG: hypothetical protein M3R46_04850 [Actinomycetota bacterium]|nr:hypothetical protein [Actinomycetota bacterium]
MLARLAGARGPESVISDRAAADVQDLISSSRLEVPIPPGARRHRAGITVHRRALQPQDVTTVDGLRVTAWPRTVLDVAAVEPTKRLALALDRTVTLRIFDLNAMEDLLERHPRAHGRRPCERRSRR